MSTQPLPSEIGYRKGAGEAGRGGKRSVIGGWAVFFGMPFVWTIPFIILSCLVGVVTGLVFFPWAGIMFTPLATFVLLYSLNRAVNEGRRRNGRIIVGYVETAVRLNLPLLPFLNAATQSERGRRRWQLAQLGNALYAGLPVSTALGELPDVPREVVGRIAAGETVGQLRHSVIQALTHDKQTEDERNENPDGPLYRIYPLFVLLTAGWIVMGMMIFVIPKFREIFKDFRTELPYSTELLMSISTWLAEDYGWLLVLPLFALMPLLASMFLTNIFIPGFRMPAFSQMGRWLGWQIPLTRTLQVNHDLGETCELLGTAIANGATLPASLQSAELLNINPAFRNRLIRFRDEIIAGNAPAAAASDASMPPLLVGLLATPTDSRESQSAMFSFLARHYRQRFSRTILFIKSATEPVFVLLFGSMVGFILFALFSPLV
ncbi:MAG TPA: type II secretion system F family protein, partial [Phycisphaerae bacterium]|nr:type II secretion system F family protein [Phycisphaerae bacterium]